MAENNIPEAGAGSSKTPWVIGVVMLLAVVGGYVALQGNGGAVREIETRQESNPVPQMTNEANLEVSAAAVQGEVKVFTVEGTNFKFNPSEIRVREGDRVKIIFKNTQGFHDWVVDEFGAATKQFSSPGEETIEFVANKKGTFEYYCSVGSHRQMGMKGNLIVE